MTNHNCLHCDQLLEGNFCSNCGQKSSTHRYSIQHFFVHDFIHGVFHLDKGFLYTVKELFTRPGHSIRGFIQGKRALHFNYFTFIIILITIGYIASNYTTVKLTDLFASSNSKELMNEVDRFSKEYPKLFTLSQIPILALSSFIIFKKSRQNFTEHLVLNTYKSSAELIIALLFTVLTIFYRDIVVLKYIYSFITIVTTAYSVWFYYQYFSVFGYGKIGLWLRSFFATIVVILLSGIITGLIVGIKVGLQQAAAK